MSSCAFLSINNFAGLWVVVVREAAASLSSGPQVETSVPSANCSELLQLVIAARLQLNAPAPAHLLEAQVRANHLVLVSCLLEPGIIPALRPAIGLARGEGGQTDEKTESTGRDILGNGNQRTRRMD